MLSLATIVLALAVALGSVLAVLHLGRGGAAAPLWLGSLHGIAALAGLGLLVAALQGPQRGQASGTASFGVIAATALALAALLGLALFTMRLRKPRVPGAIIAVHASMAVAGFVVLVVYAALG